MALPIVAVVLFGLNQVGYVGKLLQSYKNIDVNQNISILFLQKTKKSLYYLDFSLKNV